MEINKEIYRNLMNCNWLKKCGSVDVCMYDFNIHPIETEVEATKGILSTKWENVCLEERGNLTAYLACEQKEEYKRWNYEVDVIKKKFLPIIRVDIERNIARHKHSREILEDIYFNIISILMADFYSEYYQSSFLNNILKIYLSGQIPCGWEGKYPDGRLKVY